MFLSIGYVVSMIVSYMYNFCSCHVKPYVFGMLMSICTSCYILYLIVIYFRHGHTYIDCSRLPSPNR